MIFDLILEITVALFAVLGFYAALRIVADLFWAPRQLRIAIDIQTEKDADMLDMLLHEARSAFLRKGRAKLVVLLASDLMDGTVGEGDTLHDEYAELIDSFGAECYLVEM